MTPERQNRGRSSARREVPAGVAAGRVTALVTSVMDLHVRNRPAGSRQRKKRRSDQWRGHSCFGGGLTFLVLATVAGQLALDALVAQGSGLGLDPGGAGVVGR